MSGSSPTRRWLWAALVVALCIPIGVGCAEQEEGPQPIQVDPEARRNSLTEQPSEAIVNPHARLRERTDEERAREAAALGTAAGSAENAQVGSRQGGGGGGGGGRPITLDDWTPRHADPPTLREVEAFRRRLEQETPNVVDETDPACEQMRQTMIASMRSADRRPGEPRGPIPSRREMREVCGDLDRDYMQCLDRAYFRENMEECQREFQLQARRGNRRREEAQAQADAIRAQRRAPTGLMR